MLWQRGKPYSQDLRECVLAATDDGESVGQIAVLLRVSERRSPKFGQGVRLGSLLRRTDRNDGQAEAVFGGFLGESCS